MTTLCPTVNFRKYIRSTLGKYYKTEFVRLLEECQTLEEIIQTLLEHNVPPTYAETLIKKELLIPVDGVCIEQLGGYILRRMTAYINDEKNKYYATLILRKIKDIMREKGKRCISYEELEETLNLLGYQKLARDIIRSIKTYVSFILNHNRKARNFYQYNKPE